MIGMVKDINGTKQIQTLGGFTIYADLPIGSVIPYMGTVDKIPLGFLYCDNTVRHKADWPELWNVLPDILKDTVNETFTLDLRNKGLMGANPDVAGKADGNTSNVGDIQKAQLPNIVSTKMVAGAYSDMASTLKITPDGCIEQYQYGDPSYLDVYINGGSSMTMLVRQGKLDVANSNNGTGSTDHLNDNVYTANGEVRSANARVAYIIKAKQVGVPQDLLSNINALVNQLIVHKLNDQDLLSDIENADTPIPTDPASPLIIPYDGYIGGYTNTGAGAYVVNGKDILGTASGRDWQLIVQKGDTIYFRVDSGSPNTSYWQRYYKLRDYSNR